MLLTKLVLEDVGVYGGSNEFDLAATAERPIILYGGTNGAGKTTLFESILLCLYGGNFAAGTSKKKYHQKIHRMFHRNPKTRTSAGEASVALEFQYAQNGEVYQYRIVRTWGNNDGRIDESLAMHKRPASGTEYAAVDLEESQLQSLINQMIPKAVADMFFFDGEKIQSLANSGDEDSYIKSSLDALLGLDIPAQLYNDMGLYLLRNSDGDENAALADLKGLTEEKEYAEEKLGQMQEKRVFLGAEIDRKGKDMEQMENEFFKMGGTFAQNRQKLMHEKTELDGRIGLYETGLRSIIDGVLPLAIVPDQLRQVREELQSDTAKIREKTEKEVLRPAFDHMMREMDPFLDSYRPEIKGEILKRLAKIADEKLESLSDKQILAFDFSLSEMDIMQKRIDLMMDQTYESVSNIYRSHKRDLQDLEDVTAKLDVTPQQDEVAPLYSDMKNAMIEIAEMKNELSTLENMEAQKKSLIVLLNSRIRKLLSRTGTDKRRMRGMEMIPRIQDALEDYSKRLRMKKIRLLEANIFEAMQRCFHKNGLIARMSIDPDTYRITLYRKNGDEILRDDLSNGELQMYATAIIWGLARTSGRPLPFIIDTPLARLDKQHRENLVRDFYPEASHQTVIFSTDTEITDSYHEMLKPYISKEGIITYDADRDVSVIHEGYFDGGKMVAV